MPALLIGPDERIVVGNEGARRLFGQGIRGRNYITVMRQPALLDATETVLRLGRPSTALYQTTEARRDMTWNVSISPVQIGASAHVLVVFEDRTEMREAGKMRRDFVANVSHELRTPLTALLGFIETLRGAARDDPEAQDRFLGIMEREAGRMNRLVRDLLSLSRVEADERVRPTGEVELSGLIQGVVSTLQPLANEVGIEVELAGLESSHPILGDADQLSQVFTNLIENALKYSGHGGKVRVTLRTEATNELLRAPAVTVSVSDTGDGIDPLHIPRLTERFYRVDSHRSREMGGTGLGLAIVKHIVNRHRGRLKIESAPGQGSRFSVTLPSH